MDDKTFQAQVSNTDIVAGLKKANLLKDELDKLKAYTKGFEELGDWYLKQSSFVNKAPLKNHRMRLKAVCLYNLGLASGGDQQTLVYKIQMAEEGILLVDGSQPPPRSSDEYVKEIREYKQDLFAVRESAHQHLARIDIASMEVKTIYQNIAIGLKRLVTKMIERCFEQMPLPQDCQYSIIVLGSLAREEATPYSDFEWAILIENPEHKEYFRRLSQLLWVKVINLGETTARMMDIDELNWFDESDSPCKKGFSFDGQMLSGCHTPLGNHHHTGRKISEIEQSILLSLEEKAKQIQKIKEGEYELIGTPEELAQFQTQGWGTKRGFCTVLSTVAPIISNSDNLLQNYEENTRKIWDSKSESNPNQTLIQQRSLKYLSESFERFQFKGGYFGKETHYFDAKYHFYRLPNMLIDHVSSYFNIQPKNLWDRIESIFGEAGIVRFPEKANTLKQAISQVLGVRLQAYLKKGNRDDHVVMFDPRHPEKNEAAIQKYLGVDETILLQIYSELIELQWRMKLFIEQHGSLVALAKQYEYVTDFVHAELYRLLLNYPRAVTSYKEALRIRSIAYGTNHLAVADILNNLGNVYELLACYPDAIAALEGAMQILVAIYKDPNHISIADIKNNLGNVYYKANAQYAESIAAYENAKQIYINAFGPKHSSVAVVLNNLGTVYYEQARYPEAIAAYEEAKRINMGIFDDDHITVAETLNNLGLVYAAQKRYHLAIVVYNEAKRVMIAVFGPQHNIVAQPLNNLGIVYKQQFRYVEAITVYEEAKRIKINTFGRAHLTVAQTLVNLGTIYSLQTRYIEAITAYTEAKQIMLVTFDSNNLAVVETQINMGLVLIEQKKYGEARTLFQEALPLEKAKTCLKLSYIREGNSYMLQDEMDIESARRCYELALGSQFSSDPKDLKMHKGLADQFYKTGQLTAALEHYRILTILMPDNASSYHKLVCLAHARACIEQSKGEVNQVLDYLNEAESHFERAIQLDTNSGICTEYAQFLWKNRDHFDVKKIVTLLLLAINLHQVDISLSYDGIVRSTVDQYLQDLLDQQNKLTIKAIYLAHYLLIQVYCATDQLSLAMDVCRNLQILVNADADAYSLVKTTLLQGPGLFAAIPQLEQFMSTQLQPIFLVRETEQRNHACLVEGSQATIERCIVSQLHESKEPARSPTLSPRLLRDSPILGGESATKKMSIEEERESSLNKKL